MAQVNLHDLGQIDLSELAQGAVNEQFKYELQNVLNNIKNPNTEAKKPRQLIITLKFVSEEDREIVHLWSGVKTKLQNIKDIETKLIVDQDPTTGEAYAQEWGNQMKGQLSFDDDDKSVNNVVNFKR